MLWIWILLIDKQFALLWSIPMIRISLTILSLLKATIDQFILPPSPHKPSCGTSLLLSSILLGQQLLLLFLNLSINLRTSRRLIPVWTRLRKRNPTNQPRHVKEQRFGRNTHRSSRIFLRQFILSICFPAHTRIIVFLRLFFGVAKGKTSVSCTVHIYKNNPCSCID